MGRSVIGMNFVFEICSDFEFDFLNFIQSDVRNDFLDFVFPLITKLGDSGMIWILISVLLILISKYRKTGLKLIVGLLLHFIICNIILKNLIGRLRPFYFNEAIDLIIAAPDEFSFPSGHAMSSFVAATILYGYRKKWGVFAYILAILISFSRVYLYVHFPTDIIFGGIFGVVLGIFVNRSALIERWIRKGLKLKENL